MLRWIAYVIQWVTVVYFVYGWMTWMAVASLCMTLSCVRRRHRHKRVSRWHPERPWLVSRSAGGYANASLRQRHDYQQGIMPVNEQSVHVNYHFVSKIVYYDAVFTRWWLLLVETAGDFWLLQTNPLLVSLLTDFCLSNAMHSLSLIHIWRCRRIERCRSRWSPYH